MKNPPIIISIALIIVVGVTGLWLPFSESVALTPSELVQSEITLLATLGALVSAAFVVYSYLQTNLAFQESRRPQLLIQVESQKMPRSKEDIELVPLSLIHYKNVTQNQFTDLCVRVKVEANNRTVDISDLFKKKMIMVGYDSRIRRFDPIDTLSHRGVDIQKLAESGNEVIMKISYEYSFLNQLEIVECQEYKWDPNGLQWIIP